MEEPPRNGVLTAGVLVSSRDNDSAATVQNNNKIINFPPPYVYPIKCKRREKTSGGENTRIGDQIDIASRNVGW